jgi:hypothetical protein
LIGAVLLAIVALAAGTARAQPAPELHGRPDPPGVKTVVEVEAIVADVIAIHDVEQSFEIDVYFTAAWDDPRLAGEGTRRIPLDEIWNPRPQIFNERDLRSLIPRIASVSPEGRVTFVQRMIGTLAAPMDLHRFPGDEQTFPIRVVGMGYPPEELELRPGGRTLGMDSYSVTGWFLELGEARSTVIEVPGVDVRRSVVEFDIHGRRDVGFYRWTFFLPLALIVLMAWLVFWIDPSILPPQVGLGTGAVFSLIAFRLSLRLALPPVSYMTRVDLYLLGCTILVFLALGQAVATGRLAKQGHEDTARAMDAWGRWIYLAVFAVLTVLYV